MSEPLLSETDAPDDLPPDPPPAAPRPLTLRAKRRSWNELTVRIWLVLAAVVALITVYFMISRAMEGRELRWLLSEGEKITGTIIEINATKQPTFFRRSDPLRVRIGFQLPGEPDVTADGLLTQLKEPKPVRVGDKIDIRVDPSHLSQGEKAGRKIVDSWTDKTEPPPWYLQYTVVLLLVPLLLILLAAAMWRRRRVLQVWRHGRSALGRVISHHHTAIAPRSRAVRFALEETDDRRIWTALHPSENLPPPGELIWVVFPSNNPARAIVAALYE